MYFVQWQPRTLAELSFCLLTVNSLVLYLVVTAEGGTFQSGRARIALFAVVNLFTLAASALFRLICAGADRVATEPGEALARPAEWRRAVEYVGALLNVIHFMLLDHVLVSAGIPRFSHKYVTSLKLIYSVLVLQAILSNSQHYVYQWLQIGHRERVSIVCSLSYLAIFFTLTASLPAGIPLIALILTMPLFVGAILLRAFNLAGRDRGKRGDEQP
jgi:hypothetical protein